MCNDGHLCKSDTDSLTGLIKFESGANVLWSTLRNVYTEKRTPEVAPLLSILQSLRAMNTAILSTIQFGLVPG